VKGFSSMYGLCESRKKKWRLVSSRNPVRRWMKYSFSSISSFSSPRCSNDQGGLCSVT
jgi:hypothetical protein